MFYLLWKSMYWIDNLSIDEWWLFDEPLGI